MGLLDDAIREHLDLKRRRGADPAEVERDEREALGPVRRAPEGQQSSDDEPDSGFAYDQEADDEGGWSHDSLDELSHEDETAEREDDARNREPLSDDDFEFDTEPKPSAGAESAGADEHREPTPPPHPAGGAETAEFDVEEELGAKPGEDDVLEETPEFLQDTPDHDRLWFEQRPPKDFDFDG